MPFASKAQQRFMYWAHPEIARRWASKYGTIPGKKRKKLKVKEFAFGQPSHPAPAAPFSAPPPVLDLAAKAASAVPTPHNRILKAAKMRMMAKIAKRVKRRLSSMGLLKGK
jgi:hypothetical protein